MKCFDKDLNWNKQVGRWKPVKNPENKISANLFTKQPAFDYAYATA